MQVLQQFLLSRLTIYRELPQDFSIVEGECIGSPKNVTGLEVDRTAGSKQL